MQYLINDRALIRGIIQAFGLTTKLLILSEFSVTNTDDKIEITDAPAAAEASEYSYAPTDADVPGERDAGGGAAGVKKVKLRLDVKDVVRKKSDEPDADDGAPIILYEDNHLLVAVKPQNMPTQADSSGDLDFLSQLKQYLVKKYNKPGEAYLGLVHRLDRPTGGVMVFAKTSKAAARLCEQIKDKDGEFEKTYLAVASGRPNKSGKVEHYLAKDAQTNTVTVVPASMEGAKLAQSEITPISEQRGLHLVTVKLITGRPHQARVQLKTLGAPIVGDARYATKGKQVKSAHLALWAYRLTFAHPVTGDKLIFVAAPPEEFPWTLFNTDGLIDFVRPVGNN